MTSALPDVAAPVRRCRTSGQTARVTDSADHTSDTPHGGAREPGHDAAHWDERYAATDRLWSATPNATVRSVVSGLAPGRAVDVGAGEGRHAVWLAQQGWTVTAVDFSDVGLSKGREGAAAESYQLAQRIEWVVADVREWAPPPGTTYDLALVAYLHLPEDVLDRVADWLAPGGRLVVVGHDLRNLTDGVGGPQDPRLLRSVDQLRGLVGALEVERAEEVLRETPDGTAIDHLLVARRR